MRGLILAALLLPLSARAGKRYESFLIDRVDMTAVLGEPIGAFTASTAWFERSETSAGWRITDERDGGRRGEFDFAPAGRLFHRARSLAVLEGRFGRVDARFDYWYPPETPRIAVNTNLTRRSAPHREAARADSAPGPAESFALVRALKAGKTFKVATADYGLDGGLKALRVEVSSGDWTGTEVAFSSSPAVAAAWGLPRSIDAKTFPSEPFAGAAVPGEDVEAEAALIYRARGVFVERFIRRGSRIDRDFLEFPETEAERALKKLEAAFPFAAGPGR